MEIKTYCIEFERELEGKDVIHVKDFYPPTRSEAVELIRESGYIFNDGYDEVKNIYQVK